MAKMEEILKASGAEILPCEEKNPYALGSVTHEAGGARMGEDPKTFVVDKWNRCHDIKNLLIVDAACFTSHPEKPITGTIMALSLRASEHLAEDIRLSKV
jgi:choline dehydrogenase-like flavoprotein